MSKETEPTSETTVPEAKEEKGIVRGTITYPWGTVRDATVNAGEISVASDSSGKYEFSSLEPGSYNIEAHAPFPGYEASAQKIEVAAGETKVLDIYLDLEKAVVEGHVYDANGKPVAGATLSGVLYGKDMQTATTDDQGYFKFDKVTPGDRFMRVNARGYVGETKDFTAKKEGPTVIEFRLQPASCRVYGVVRDESDKPLQAEILLMKTGIVIQKTNSDVATGSFEFPVVPGIYEINAVASGYQPRGWHGSVSGDVKVDFSMALTPEEPSDETT
jgi:hypothetical protein